MTQVAEETEREAGTEAVVKKFMFVNRKAPHGTIYAPEGLEVVLRSQRSVYTSTLVESTSSVR